MPVGGEPRQVSEGIEAKLNETAVADQHPTKVGTDKALLQFNERRQSSHLRHRRENPKPVYRVNLDPNEISDFVMNLLGSAMEQKFNPVERMNWLAVKPTRVSVERIDRPDPIILAFECGEVTVNFVIRDPKTLGEALIKHAVADDAGGQRE